jgi:hypothetical protein
MNSYKCLKQFSGASAKRAPFKGWAGPVVEWELKKPPTVDFGKWTSERASEYNGGTVECQCQPLALVMFGANSKDMRVKDKTTQFGIAGLAPNRQLHIAPLPRGIDARAIFAAGGWSAPNVDELAKELRIILAKVHLVPIELENELQSFERKICEGFFIIHRDLFDTLSSWPELSVLHADLQEATTNLQKMKAQYKESHRIKMLCAVNKAIEKLKTSEKDISLLAVASILVDEPDLNQHSVKEKARHIKRLLGDEIDQLINQSL